MDRRKKSPLFTVVDLESFEKIRKFKTKWIAAYKENTNSYYAQASIYIGTFDGKREYQTVYLHRLILESEEKRVGDHKDHDTLNNRRSNLVDVTYQENSLNRKGANSNNTNGQKNITFDKSNGKYLVQKSVNGKNTGFGTFETLDEAVKIRDMIEKMSDDEKLEFKRKNKKKSGRKKKAIS